LYRDLSSARPTRNAQISRLPSLFFANRAIVRAGVAVPLVLWPPTVAEAHPFGDRFVAQRLDVHITRSSVEVGFVADVPDALLSGAGGNADVSASLRSFSNGIVLTVDGATVPLTVRHSADRTDLVSPHTHIMEVVLVATVDLTGQHKVEVSNGNLQGQASYYLTKVEFGSTATMHASSLLLEPKGVAAVDRSQAWSRSELRRRYAVDIYFPDTAWATLFEFVDPGRLRHDHITKVSAWPDWRSRTASPPGVALGMAAASLVGGAAGASGLRWKAIAGGVVAVATGAALCALSGPPPTAVLVGLCASALFLGLKATWPVGMWGVVAVALAASDPWQGATLAAGAAAGLVGLFTPVAWRHDRHGWLGLVLAAIVAGAAYSEDELPVPEVIEPEDPGPQRSRP
jgi:hypothetical protein